MTSPFINLPSRFGSRSGFTLVEILVVIAIIALLAGVALPAITGAIKKGKESAAVETSHGIATAMFQYNTDQGAYPYGTTSELALSTLVPAYVSNTDILFLAGAGGSKYTGSAVAPVVLNKVNVSWDVITRTTPAGGLTSNDPDETPLIVSTGTATYNLGAAGTTAAATATMPATGFGSYPFGSDGLVVASKGLASSFAVNLTPGTASNIAISPSSFTPATGYTAVIP